jgi:hypothetical protein
LPEQVLLWRCSLLAKSPTSVAKGAARCCAAKRAASLLLLLSCLAALLLEMVVF